MRVFFCIVLVLMACNRERPDERGSASGEDTTGEAVPDRDEIPADQQTDLSTTTSAIQFVNDDIGSYPFATDFETMITSRPDVEALKKPFQNLHDSTKTDTLVSVHFGKSVIEYYKVQASNSGFIVQATILDNDVKFKKGIRIGMSVGEFFSLFDELRHAEKLNTVIISTFEGLNQTEFVFAYDTLSTVNYQSYFD